MSNRGQNPPVYVLSGPNLLTIPYNSSQTVQRPNFHPSEAMVAARCKKCESVNVITGDIEETESSSRGDESMGNDTYYSAECTRDCAVCGAELGVDVNISEYAGGWTFHDHTDDGCDLIEVYGFKDALEALGELSRRSQTKDVIA